MLSVYSASGVKRPNTEIRNAYIWAPVADFTLCYTCRRMSVSESELRLEMIEVALDREQRFRCTRKR